MTHIETLRYFLRDTDTAAKASPAESLDLPTGETDRDGWELFNSYYVGNIVKTFSGDTYRIMGFTFDDHIIGKPYGLTADPSIHSVEFLPESVCFSSSEEIQWHKDGLVIFV